MVKTSVALSRGYKEKIERGARLLGVSQSEFLRRAVDEYLSKLGITPVLEEVRRVDG